MAKKGEDQISPPPLPTTHDIHLLHLSPSLSCYTTSDLETRTVHREIFEEHCYDLPSLLPPPPPPPPPRSPSPQSSPQYSPFIIDIGAHIGLFTLYTKAHYPTSTILAFEPAPQTHTALRRNLTLHNLTRSVKALPLALGSSPSATTRKLTYYPNAHANSTFLPESKKTMKLLLTDALGESFTHAYFESVQVDVRVERLSDVLDREYGVDGGGGVGRIDLIKVDVEGMEGEVLRGIEGRHWDVVGGVVVEVSGGEEGLGVVEGLLRQRGFVVESVRAEGPEELGMWMVRGRRGVGWVPGKIDKGGEGGREEGCLGGGVVKG
ncbi:hypothetical protein AJ79_03310 [Helicocarpus griseus UAMH5409]|uniref:Methyltransferase FkbM domain-containing protein n=1 Tax=Helicocarpus griseus UAMH5409 TaxID=1447875 RepID=A0A2B7XYD7_9EURO|nr:hypothetical protein AJ79_03310 [Helicocarpus griseus UAMH5409]